MQHREFWQNGYFNTREVEVHAEAAKIFKEGTIHDIPLKPGLSLLDFFGAWLSPAAPCKARCDCDGVLQLAHPQHWLGNITGLHLAPGVPHETAKIAGGQALQCAQLEPLWAYSP